MKKHILTLLISVFLFNSFAIADEGMWIPLLLNKKYEEMKKAGMKLSAEDIYSINQSSLKDAIIQFGNGCTGEIISKEALVLTNHHCGFGQIQSHSSVEHDYLTDGFWAKSKSEELANEGLTAKFLVRMEDVTSKIIPFLSDTMKEIQRYKMIEKLAIEIEKQSVTGTHYEAVVKSIFDGNQYFLFVYEIFKDVRLVGAPPSSIGKFGGDTDNWMWPRHTGDFSLFRIYMAPDGNPAEYSKENIPYKPKHHLPISIKGVKENDFAMIMGYPGRTNRYVSSFGVNEAINFTNPAVVKIRDKKLNILRDRMSNSDEIRIKYASKYARVSNYWKYYIGQTKQLKNNNVVAKKQEIEANFETWINANNERKQRYGNLISELGKTYSDLKNYNVLQKYSTEASLSGIEIMDFADNFVPLYKALKAEDTNKILEEKVKLLKVIQDFFKNYDLETDKQIFQSLLEIFYRDVAPEFQPSIFAEIAKKHKGNFKTFTEEAYSKSMFCNNQMLIDFLNNPTKKALDKDLIFKTTISVRNNYAKYAKLNQPIIEKQDSLKRIFMKGLMEMDTDKIFYPNANSTMRLTYGNVSSYVPFDAVSYDFYTTIDGIMEKMDNSVREFTVPQKLQDLYKAKDYGVYGSNGTLNVCFLTTNDITGGNSGSPVIGANGELIGLAFDGNWEAMSGDISFEQNVQRTICVDARYLLFIIDKYAGAKHLVDEMTLFEN